MGVFIMSNTIKQVTNQSIKPASREFTNNNKTNQPQQKKLTGKTSIFLRLNDKNITALMNILKELVDSLQGYVQSNQSQGNDNQQQGTVGNDYLSGTSANDDI